MRLAPRVTVWDATPTPTNGPGSRRIYKINALVLLAALTLQGCTLAGSVAIYKYRFKDRLLALCEKDETCVTDVDTHFDRCLDNVAVGEMILTVDVKHSREMNRALQSDTILCINTASQTTHFAFKAPGES